MCSSLVLICLLTHAIHASEREPNVIVLFSDDQGYADLGLHGSEVVKTPNIDSIGKNGIRFTSGYVTAPQCSPSRAGLLSGRYQQRFGMEVNGAKNPDFGIPADVPLMGEYMRKAGYATAAIGKWHVGNKESLRAIDRGFDWVWSMQGESRKDLAYLGFELNNNRRTPSSTHKTNYLTLGALHFIEKNRERPFFMYLAYHVPHAPYISRSKWMDKNRHVKNGDKRVLAAMMSELDESVGRIS